MPVGNHNASLLRRQPGGVLVPSSKDIALALDTVSCSKQPSPQAAVYGCIAASILLNAVKR